MALCATVLAAPSLPALGAVLDPDVPMVASARTTAERAPAQVTIGTTTAATTAATVAPSSSEASVVADVVRLTNRERAAAGLAALVVHPAAGAAAAHHSLDQATMGRMTHTGSDGSDGGDRLTRAGFGWLAWGENVAVGQHDAQDVVSAWMRSSGHRANMLNGRFTTIGVGVATGADGARYWTMVLAA